MRTNVLKGAVFILIGVGLLAAAIALGRAKREFIRKAASSDGVVVRLNAGGSHPQIEFTSAAGNKVSYPQGGLIFGYKTGDRVRVFYDPQNPQGTACVDAAGALWFAPVLAGVLGIVLVIVGFIFAV